MIMIKNKKCEYNMIIISPFVNNKFLNVRLVRYSFALYCHAYKNNIQIKVINNYKIN